MPGDRGFIDLQPPDVDPTEAREWLDSVQFLATLPAARIIIRATVPVMILVVQIVVIRPRLAWRSDRVIAGNDARGSNEHYW
jgi:hypothetical protein